MPVPITCGALSRNRRTVSRVRWTRSSANSLDSIFCGELFLIDRVENVVQIRQQRAEG